MQLEKFCKIKELFGITDLELTNLTLKVKRLESISLNVIENNINYFKSLGANPSDISFIALNGGATIFTCYTPVLIENSETIRKIFNLSDSEIVSMYMSNCSPHFLYLSKEELEQKFENFKTATGLSEEITKQILTSTFCLKSDDYTLTTIKKINLLKNYIDLNDLNNNSQILSQSLERLEHQFKLAIINDLEPKTFIQNQNYKLPVSKIYARTMAKINGEIPACGTIFLSEKYFNLNYNLTTISLMGKYPYDENADKIINNLYEKKMEEIQIKKAQEIAKENRTTNSKKQEKYEKTKNCLNLFKNNFNLSNGEIYNIINHFPQVLDLNQESLNTRITLLIRDYGFNFGDINRIALQSPLLFTTDENQILSLQSYLAQTYNITNDDFKLIILNNKNILSSTPEKLEKYKNQLINEVGITALECKSLLVNTTSFGYQEPREIKAKLKLLELAGISKETLNGDIGIVSGSFDNLETKIKILLLTNGDTEKFTNGGYMFSVKKLYSRYRLLKDFNKLYKQPLFLPHNEFYMGLGINPKETANLYPYDITSTKIIDDDFEKLYPEISAKIKKVRDFYLNLNNNEIELIEELKLKQQNAKEVKDTSLLEVFANETNLSEDEIDNIISSLDLKSAPELATKIEKKIKKFKRLTQASNKDLSEFLVKYPTILIDEDNKILINIITLMELGIPFEVSKNKPKALTLNPEKTKIRLILSRLCEVPDNQFLNGLCSYDESNVYSKMCALRAKQLKPIFAYSPNSKFEEILGLTLSDCKDIFAYDTSIKQQLEDNYHDLIKRVKENQGEVYNEN